MSYFNGAFILLIIEMNFGNCFESGLFSTILIASSILLLLFSMDKQIYCKKEFLVATLILGVSIIVTFYTGENVALFISTLFFGIKKINLERSIKIYFWVNLLCLIGIFFLYKIGVRPDVIVYRLKDTEKIVRHSYGFAHPNELAMRLVVIMLAWLYLQKRYTKKNILICGFAWGGVYLITDSRGAVVIIGIAFAIEFLHKYLYVIKKSKIIQIILKNLFLLFAVIEIVVSMLFGKNFENPVNTFLSFRPYYWKGVIDNCSMIGIRNFSDFSTENRIVVDSTYIYVLGAFGIAFLMIYAILFHVAIKRLLQQNMIKEIVYICVFCGYGMVETMISPIKNFSMLFILFALQSRQYIEENSKHLQVDS